MPVYRFLFLALWCPLAAAQCGNTLLENPLEQPSYAAAHRLRQAESIVYSLAKKGLPDTSVKSVNLYRYDSIGRLVSVTSRDAHGTLLHEKNFTYAGSGQLPASVFFRQGDGYLEVSETTQSEGDSLRQTTRQYYYPQTGITTVFYHRFFYRDNGLVQKQVLNQTGELTETSTFTRNRKGAVTIEREYRVSCNGCASRVYVRRYKNGRLIGYRDENDDYSVVFSPGEVVASRKNKKTETHHYAYDAAGLLRSISSVYAENICTHNELVKVVRVEFYDEP